MQSVGIRLVGGLGNQMFQYAAARALSLRTGSRLMLDVSWFGTDPNRQFALAPFSIEAEIFNFMGKPNPTLGFLGRVMRKLSPVRRKGGVPIFAEASFCYDPRIEQVNPPVFMDGYFQSEKYFSNIREQLRRDFTLRSPPAAAAARMLDLIQSVDAICLHIRRGDYVSNPEANAYHGTCSLDYYRRAVDFVANGIRQPHCFVFSDDPSWVRENFRSEMPMTLVDIHSTDAAHEDLRLMVACQHYIIANSSLSWWGAWLGRHPGKLVVAPRVWFQKGGIDTTDLLPSQWHRL